MRDEVRERGNVPQRVTAARVARAVHGKPVRPASGCRRAWKGFCPSHADKQRSLAVSEKPDGRILLKCFAGCPLEDILDKLRMEKQDLFPVRAMRQAIVFRYNYWDERHCLLYRIVRVRPKGFFVERPDGRGGWQRGSEGTRKVLYRLPEVLKSDRVLICEGEKDCQTIRRLEKFLGFPYTATTSGSADSWKAEYGEWLRGKCVVIVPDKDKGGAKSRRQIVSSLRDKAASLKVVRLPVGKDVTAWIEAGGSQDWEGAIEQLEQFISEASELRRRRPGDYEVTILAFLHSGGKTLKQIRAGVKGKTCVLDKALRNLCACGKVQISGAGVRNSPFVYSLSSLSLPHNSLSRHTHSLRNVLPTAECDKDKSRMNSEPILVPNSSTADFLKGESKIEKRA